MCHGFFIHSSVYGHSGCFHGLAIVNSGSMNVGVSASFSILVSSGYMPSSWITGHMAVLFLVLFNFLF